MYTVVERAGVELASRIGNVARHVAPIRRTIGDRSQVELGSTLRSSLASSSRPRLEQRDSV